MDPSGTIFHHGHRHEHRSRGRSPSRRPVTRLTSAPKETLLSQVAKHNADAPSASSATEMPLVPSPSSPTEGSEVAPRWVPPGQKAPPAAPPKVTGAPGAPRRTSSHQAGDWQTPAEMRGSSIGTLERQLSTFSEAAAAALDIAATKYREAADAYRAGASAMLQADRLNVQILELREQLQRAMLCKQVV